MKELLRRMSSYSPFLMLTKQSHDHEILGVLGQLLLYWERTLGLLFNLRTHTLILIILLLCCCIKFFPKLLAWDNTCILSHRLCGSWVSRSAGSFAFRVVTWRSRLEIFQVTQIQGFPGGASGKEPACQCRRHIPWRTAWKSIPVFLPRESHRQRSLAGSMGLQRVGQDWSYLAAADMEKYYLPGETIWHVEKALKLLSHRGQVSNYVSAT